MGSAVNVGYGLQWPVFAVFFAWIWWRMLRIEIAKLPTSAEPEPQSAPPPVDRAPSPFAYRPGRVGPIDEAESPALAERCRWRPLDAVVILLAGTIPIASFVAERQVTRRVREGRAVLGSG